MKFIVACLKLDCAKAQRHVKECVAYGQPYPKSSKTNKEKK